MSDLIDLKNYAKFRDASARAMELATTHGGSAWVRRASDGWVVAVPPSIAGRLTTESEQPVAWHSLDEGKCETHALAVFDEYEQDTLAELMEEIEEDRENFARSEEEGWFYAD